MTWLFILLFVLLIVMLAGHGLWVFLAFIFRSSSGDARRPQITVDPTICPRCNTSLQPHSRKCTACGWPDASSITSKMLADVMATQRQLERFRERGVIDEATFRKLSVDLESDRKRLLSGEYVAPSTPSQPAPRTAVPPPLPVSPSLPPIISAPPVPMQETVEELPERIVPPDEFPSEVAPPPIAIPPPVFQPPQPPPKPSKPFTEVLASFLEAKNIRWGELVGGLLIIGCSVALVVSLWAQISSIPVLKFFIFTAVTAALFGVGLYTEHRWKLPMTSRVLLIIASLLVPLNFLAIAAFSEGTPPKNLLAIGGELFAIVLFLWLVNLAARVLVQSWAHFTAVAVLGASASQLLARRFIEPFPNLSLPLLLTFGAMPLICYGSAAIWATVETKKKETVDESEASKLFTLLGLVAFAAVLTLGLVVYKTGDTRWALRGLAPLIALMGVPALLAGGLLWKRLTAPELGGMSTAATTIALAGAGLMLAAIVMAWPNTTSILTVSLVNCIALTLVAVLFEIPALYLLAVACFGFAYLVGFHIVAGHVGWQTQDAGELASNLLSGFSGRAVVPLFALVAGIAAWLSKRNRRADAEYLSYACGLIALFSVALVAFFGFGRVGDPQGVIWVFAFYSVASFWGAWRAKRVALTWIGLILIFPTLAQAFLFKLEVDEPWQMMVLAHTTLTVFAAMLKRRGSKEVTTLFAVPANRAAQATAWVSAFVLLFAIPSSTAAHVCGLTFWLAALLMALALVNRSLVFFTASQVSITFGVVFAVTMWLDYREWYRGLYSPWTDPRTIQAHGIALGLLSLAWGLGRLWLQRVVAVKVAQSSSLRTSDEAPAASVAKSDGWLEFARRIASPKLAFDRAMTFVVLLALFGLVLVGLDPCIGVEFSSLSSAQALALSSGGHNYELGFGSWVLVAVLLAVFAMELWRRVEMRFVVGLMLTLFAVCPLLAGRWEGQAAVASAFRWIIVAYLLVVSVPLWLRNRWFGEIKFGEGSSTTGIPVEAVRSIRVLLLCLTLIPLLALTLPPIARTLLGGPVIGPTAESFFGRIGDTLSYSLPLLAASLALIGHAIRERSSGFAFSAGLLLNLTVTLGYLLSLVKARAHFGLEELVRLVQFNAITVAVFALGWLAWRAFWARRDKAVAGTVSKDWLRVQVWMGVVVNALLLVPATMWFMFGPPFAAHERIYCVGDVWGWLAFISMASAYGWWRFLVEAPSNGETWSGKLRYVLSKVDAVTVCVFGLVSLVVFGFYPWSESNWLGGYHMLMASYVVGAWLLLGFDWLQKRFAQAVVQSEATSGAVPPIAIPPPLKKQKRSLTFEDASFSMSLIVVVLAMFTQTSDANEWWWSVGAIISVSLLTIVLACWARNGNYLYVSGVLLNLAATMWWISQDWFRLEPPLELIEVNVVALALPAIAWLLLERWMKERGREMTRVAQLPPFHHVAAFGSVLVVGGLVATKLARMAWGERIETNLWLDWIAVGASVAVMTACLWDAAVKYTVGGLYALGAVAIGMGLTQHDLSLHEMAWMGAAMLAAYSVATGCLWKWRDGVVAWARGLRIPNRADSTVNHHAWLAPSQLVLTTVIVALSFWGVLTFDELHLRLVAAAAVLAQALAMGLLADEAWRQRLQWVSLSLAAIGAVAFGWAWLPSESADVLLYRAVILMAIVAGIIGVDGSLLKRLLGASNDWSAAARRLVPGLVLIVVASVVFVLGTEVQHVMATGEVRIHWLAIVTVAATLVGMGAICIVFAVAPGRDPLGLSESGRMAYVYAAEVLLGLVVMHLRLTAPELFKLLVFRKYWPLAVMGIAFAGVGVSEFFRRRGQRVLAEPLERTGMFLPVMPVLGFWVLQTQVHYSVLLLTVALLYGVLSVMRRSFWFALLAAVAANGALWYFLHHIEGFGFFRHPQLWLIPLSVSVLAAAYLNRARLAKEQLIAIRFAATTTIYASSTADVFLVGVANAPWLPMVLAGLSVAGIFAGIMLRVRAFLSLGLAFLLLAILTMIWYAAVDLHQTWLWYVSGIILGVAIVTLFALFEKKRQEMMKVLEQFRQWEM